MQRERTDAKPTAFRVNGATLVQLGAGDKASRVRHAVDALSIAQQSGLVDVGARTAPLAVEAGAVTAGSTSVESQNLDAVGAAFGSAEGLAPHFSPDAVIEDLTAGQTAHGRDAVAAAMARVKGAFPAVAMTAESSFAAGPFVVVDRVVTGRSTGALGPLPATGRPVRYHALDVYELSNGVITRAWLYADRSEVAVQLGLNSAEAIPGLGVGAK